MSGRMRRWVDRQGQAWECDAYDHGPFCRLCRQIRLSDLIDQEILALVEEGLMEFRFDASGNPQVRLTAEGNAVASQLIEQYGIGEPDDD